MKKKYLKKFKELSKTGWYHPIDFGNSHITDNKVRASDDGSFRGIERWKFLKKYIPNLKNKRVIDLGCNAGIFSIQAVRDGALYVLGLDNSQIAIEKALFVREVFSDNEKIDYIKKVDFKVCDIVKENLKQFGKFNIAFLFGLVYHLGNKGTVKVLEELKKMVEVVAIQAKYFNKKKLCSPEEIKEVLIKSNFHDIHLYDGYYSSGKKYLKPLIIARSMHER